MLFGNENGEQDALLDDCSIDIASSADEPRIFAGRWGSGKSAQLFIANKALRHFLMTRGAEDNSLWYIDENSLDAAALADLRREVADAKAFRFCAEKIWRAEILRTASTMLGFLAQIGGTTSDPHWKFVKSVFSGGKLADSLWLNARPLLRLILSDNQKYEAATELTGNVEDLMSRQTFTYVQRCLRDCRVGFPRIAVAVEPIDTPDSPLEKADTQIAQDVIAALINVFLRSFQPSAHQGLDVYMAIPWHRYTTEGIINPQKRREYEAKLQWTSDELHSFICSRIRYEFKRVGRPPRPNADVWEELFVPTILNTYCQNRFEEHTLQYILRHTHHRPRDVQHICREAVFACAKKAHMSADDVVKGKNGIRVNGSHIREAVQYYCTDALEDFQEEARRRYPDMPHIESTVQGISVPFTTEALKKRSESRFPGDIREVIKTLWDTGYLGIEVVCKNNKAVDQHKALFPSETFITHKTDHVEFNLWYFYSYNWKGEPFELLAKAESEAALSAQCVLHARTFDKIAGHVTQEWPVGI